MSQLDQLKDLLRKNNLYIEDKFEEWVSLARTTNQTLDRVLTASGYLTEAQMTGSEQYVSGPWRRSW